MRFLNPLSILVFFLFLGCVHEYIIKNLQLNIIHPGFDQHSQKILNVSVICDENGEPNSYTAEVESVFCSEKHCEVITLEMVWDVTGKFKSYQLKNGDKLTKYDHKPFTNNDYQKFNELMVSKGSILGSVEKSEIIVPNREANKNTQKKLKDDSQINVDAVSGATSNFIKDEVVEGAAYTCFTMWHWANGDLSKKIRAHSQSSLSREKILKLIISSNPETVKFCCETLIQQKIIDDEAINSFINVFEKRQLNDFSLLKKYLLLYDKEIRLKAYVTLFHTVDSDFRVKIFNELSELNWLSLAVIEDLLSNNRGFENYNELKIFLELIENKKLKSEKINNQLVALLSHENFFMARRVYEYLSKTDMTPKLQMELENFKAKNFNRIKF